MSRPPSEAAVLVSAMEAHGQDFPVNLDRVLKYAPATFDDLRYGQIARAIYECKNEGREPHLIEVGDKLTAFKQSEAGMELALLPWGGLPLALVDIEAEKIWERYRGRRMATVFDEAAKALVDSPDKAKTISAGVTATLESLFSETSSLKDRLSARLFNFASPPLAAVPLYTLQGIPVSTVGNLTTISAQAKGGKSSVIAAKIAAVISGGGDSCLGFKSFNPDDKMVLHLDTEQSIEDCDALMRKALSRAGADQPPPWLKSYCVTGFSVMELKQVLHSQLKEAKKQFGGVHSVFLDGTADFVLDVNDPGETNPFVSELHGLAVEYGCAIINVIHLNPGSTDKTRGHLGSQLERKSETNLRLERDGEATIIWSDKNRKAPITKERGPRFIWSDEDWMHVLTVSAGQVKDAAKCESLKGLVEDLFSSKSAMKYGEAIITLEASGIKSKTAQGKFTEFKKFGLVKQSVAGLWVKGF